MLSQPLKSSGARGLCLLTLAGFLASTARPADDSLARLLACRAVADSAARLACFDLESGHLATVATAPAAAPVAETPHLEQRDTASNSKENFGLPEGTISKKEIAAGTRAAEAKSIEAHVVAVASTPAGLATFTLDNGQVWREITAAGDLLAKPGQAVTVSLGVFHSYWLQTSSGRGCKVTRIL